MTIAELSPRTLEDLGHALLARARAARKARPGAYVVARRGLTPEGIDRLVEIVAGGSHPTVGFFLRYRRSEAP